MANFNRKGYNHYSYVAYPTNKQNLNELFLPKINSSKVIHSKNPRRTKPFAPLDESKEPKRLLDGFLLLKKTNNDNANQVVAAKLSGLSSTNLGLNIVDAKTEEFLFFENLKKLDLSENKLTLEQLITFPNLQELNLSSNNIGTLNNIASFTQLQTLDISFNCLNPDSLQILSEIDNLRNLNIGGNNLKELIFEPGNFTRLEILNLSSNLFTSNYKPSEFWEKLAQLKNLKSLDISFNKMRGIHTELLKPGDFDKLEYLDFSKNLVDNQHNLICARNFESLKELIVTGNPFAKINMVEALKLEIYTRTGAIVINEQEYEKKKKKEINYPEFIRVKDDNIWIRKKKLEKQNILKSENKDESQEMKPFDLDESGKKIDIEKQNLEFDFSRQEASSINDEDQFFLTAEGVQHNNIRATSNKHDYETKKLSQFLSSNEIATIKYDEFKILAQQYLADEKEYDNPLKTASALKILKNIIYKPVISEVFPKDEPHYMKETKIIKRYKGGDPKTIDEIIHKDIANLSNYGYVQKAKDSTKEYKQFKELNEVLNAIRDKAQK